ncbi:MAG: M50 family metallopeptidase [Clostridia bacterium]
MILAAVTFADIGYVIVALLCLMFLIVVHEFGHYLAGKLLGFKINEFAIGFGPAIFKHKSKKTGELFAIRCIPLGGFCAFEGEDEETESELAFTKQKPWKRIIVLFAGAFFNYMCAILFISIFFMAYGDFMPKISETYLNSAGQQFEAEDIILEVDGKGVYTLLGNSSFDKMLKEDSAKVLVLRDGKKQELTIKKGNYTAQLENGATEQKYGFGISVGYTRYKYGFFGAIGRAFVFSFKIVIMLFTTIGSVFTGALGIKGTIGGPITAIGSIANLSKGGFDAIMYGVCVLSANLAIMNLLPIPALDGSRILFTAIEWVRGKPINRKVEAIIHTVGLVCLFALTIILDIVNWV